MSEERPAQKLESNPGAIERAKNWMKNHEKSLLLTVGLMMGGAGGAVVGASHERESIENDPAQIEQLIEQSPELRGVQFTGEFYSEQSDGSVKISSTVEIAGKQIHVFVDFGDNVRSLKITEEGGHLSSDEVTKYDYQKDANIIRNDQDEYKTTGPNFPPSRGQ